MNESLKIVIVEDEMIIAESISRSLKSLGYNPLEPVINFTSAIELINREKPDLVLIDIRLSGSKDGIDLAAEINALHGIPFIFLTSNSDPLTIERAKMTHPAAYLLKPFTTADLYSTIEIAFQNQKNIKEQKESKKELANDFILVKHKKTFAKVFFDDILFINSQHVYIEISTLQGKKLLVRTSINEYLKLLPTFFIKVHRSYVINIHYIDEIITQSVILKGVTIPVAREYRKGLSEIVYRG